ncbi:cytochrome c oxidase accessory protein FixG [Prosthecobacter fusiformis]|uniref:Cytochrome c oxidase accessory protein FixG n=1 Tax=Prosthecobacter fusiformis TaxID=48464 RepID=A0A4R7S2B6_9BACT|nr:cytochrome c oxidase accessory protein CcoG [Prosthecobacter fusiformis]TDU71147.1 cytochrome c oxidase accessory protein FixG [Prosthecobacter fusiformis]
MKSPTLESLSSIRADGSHRTIHPADVRGRFTAWRRGSALLLLGIYISLPWIPINGYPAVFLDVQERRFHFMGLTLATQDLWVGFFLITGLAFSLFYVTALFGRVWCGWTCPYTVFLEHVYRRIERWIDGDATARRKLDAAPWSFSKAIRRGLKHTIFLFVSAVIAHIFLSYYVSLKTLYQMMLGPPSQHLMAFGIMLFLTGGLYFAFSWFREQFCVILCPYGRLQSALTDDHSVVIGYDKRRGEPRGKVGSTSGACVDCRRCVQVCPTGIDIRNGLQLDCIGCAACVDACDDIMLKLKRPTGLVRYDSHVGLHGGRTRFIRPRIILYTGLLLLGIGAFAFSALQLSPVRASVVRMVGAPFYVADGTLRNQFLVRVINKRNSPSTYRLELTGDFPAQLSISGLNETLNLDPLGEEQKTLVLSLPEAAFNQPFKLQVKVIDAVRGDAVTTRVMEFLGPDTRLKTNAPLNPKDYIQ